MVLVVFATVAASRVSARQWSFVGIPEPLEAELATVKNGYALLRGPEGNGAEVPLGKFTAADGWLFVDRIAPSVVASRFLDRFLEKIHERTQRPIWVTEWNNGANWTGGRDPSPADQKRAISAMIEMLDETPFVERYALYNWVEGCRRLVHDNGTLTPAGEVYRDLVAPVAFVQPKRYD